MSFYESLMINEALSLTITEILSFENLQKSPLFSKMHPIQPNEIFSKFPCDIYWPRVRSMLFENFDPPYAIVMAYKWLTSEKSVRHPTKTIKNVKKLEMVRRLKLNFALFRKFLSILETL